MYAIFPKTRDSQKVIDQYTALGSKDAIIKILKAKFISSKEFTNLTICGNEIWFDSPQESYCINIKKKEIAETLKSIFDLAFERAKELDEKSK